MLTAFAVLRSISEPFDCGKTREVKLTFDPIHALEGEVYLRVPADHASRYTVGDTYSVCLSRVP